MLGVVGQLCFERPGHSKAGLGQEPATSVKGYDLANGRLGRADELGRLEGSNGVADTDVGDGCVGVVHRTYMGGVERGERNLTLKSLEKMAEQIGVEVLTLLGK